MNPRISIITPFYNSKKFIFETISNILDINFKNFELILIDDGSSDNSHSVIQKIKDPRILILRNSYNKGLAYSINKAIKISKSKYILRIDSDDLVDKFILDKLINTIEEKKCDAVACDYYLYYKKRDLVYKESINFPIACGILFKKDSLFEVGLFNENFKYAEEEEFRKRFLERFKIYYINEALYYYRQHESNRSKNTDMVNKYRKKIK